MTYTFRPTIVSILFALVVFSALLNLGVWQLNRAEIKQLLKTQYLLRSHSLIDLTALDTPARDLRYYRITLTGQFDNEHSLLLDNKIQDHQVGYDIVTPFYVFGSDKVILVNRGWVPQGASRAQLPAVEPLFGQQTITGILMPTDQGGMQLGTDDFENDWPWVVQNIDLPQVSKILNHDFYNYMVTLNTQAVPVTTMIQPEKHIAYAVQWFALALTFLVMFCLLHLKRK